MKKTLEKAKSIGTRVLWGLFAGALGFGLCWVTSGASNREMTLKLPGGGELSFKDSQLDYPTVLKEIYSDQLDRKWLLGWLAKKEIFPINDVQLVTALEKSLCDVIPPDPLKARLDAAKRCAEMPVAKQLRQMALQHTVPFHYAGEPIDVGIPPQQKPQPGRASVCSDSRYTGRRIELLHPSLDGRRIEVRAQGGYACEGSSRFPDMQLNTVDAERLFSRPWDKTQVAIATILD